jgi:hypothetical protein
MAALFETHRNGWVRPAISVAAPDLDLRVFVP